MSNLNTVIATPVCTPWLSVLVPVYNVQAYLAQCVQSVLSQGVAGVEVLLLDDAATDGSAAIMQTLAQKHPDSVRVFAHETNRGLAAARNTLLGHALGRYVWFLDSDDLLFPGAIAALEKIVHTSAPDMVLCDFGYVREHMRLVHRLRGEAHRSAFAFDAVNPCEDRAKLLLGLIQSAQLHAWSKIARREIWQCAPFPEGQYFEDIPTIPALVRATTRFIHVAKPWVGYRQREGSILAKYNSTKLTHLLNGLLELNQGVRTLSAEQNLGCEAAVEDFCLRTVASAVQRIDRLTEPEQIDSLRSNFQLALPVLFPNGVASVLSRWLRAGWWVRTLRIRSRLRKAGFL